MTSLDELTALKEKVAAAQEERSRAAGALDEVMKRLRKDFNCDSIEEAETAHAELLEETEQAEQRFNRALRKFKEKFADQLGEQNE